MDRVLDSWASAHLLLFGARLWVAGVGVCLSAIHTGLATDDTGRRRRPGGSCSHRILAGVKLPVFYFEYSSDRRELVLDTAIP